MAGQKNTPAVPVVKPTIAEAMKKRSEDPETGCLGALYEEIEKKFQFFFVDDNPSKKYRDPDDIPEFFSEHEVVTFVFADNSWLRTLPQLEKSTYGILPLVGGAVAA